MKYAFEHYLVAEGKLLILEDMSVVIQDVIENTNYVRLYYPLDDTIMNKGYLTLIVPEYIAHMYSLFKTIGDSIIKENKETKKY